MLSGQLLKRVLEKALTSTCSTVSIIKVPQHEYDRTRPPNPVLGGTSSELSSHVHGLGLGSTLSSCDPRFQKSMSISRHGRCMHADYRAGAELRFFHDQNNPGQRRRRARLESLALVPAGKDCRHLPARGAQPGPALKKSSSSQDSSTPTEELRKRERARGKPAQKKARHHSSGSAETHSPRSISG